MPVCTTSTGGRKLRSRWLISALAVLVRLARLIAQPTATTASATGWPCGRTCSVTGTAHAAAAGQGRTPASAARRGTGIESRHGKNLVPTIARRRRRRGHPTAVDGWARCGALGVASVTRTGAGRKTPKRAQACLRDARLAGSGLGQHQRQAAQCGPGVERPVRVAQALGDAVHRLRGAHQAGAVGGVEARRDAPSRLLAPQTRASRSASGSGRPASSAARMRARARTSSATVQCTSTGLAPAAKPSSMSQHA